MRQPIVFLFTILLSFALQAQAKPPTETEATLEEAKEFILYVLNTASEINILDAAAIGYGNNDSWTLITNKSGSTNWILDKGLLIGTQIRENDKIIYEIDFFGHSSIELVINKERNPQERIKVLGSRFVTNWDQRNDGVLTKTNDLVGFSLMIKSGEKDVHSRFYNALLHYLKLSSIEPKRSKF